MTLPLEIAKPLSLFQTSRLLSLGLFHKILRIYDSQGFEICSPDFQSLGIFLATSADGHQESRQSNRIALRTSTRDQGLALANRKMERTFALNVILSRRFRSMCSSFLVARPQQNCRFNSLSRSPSLTMNNHLMFSHQNLPALGLDHRII